MLLPVSSVSFFFRAPSHQQKPKRTKNDRKPHAPVPECLGPPVRPVCDWRALKHKRERQTTRTLEIKEKCIPRWIKISLKCSIK